MALDIEAARKAALEAERALATFNARLAQYQDAAKRRDWDHLERMRLECVSACESFLDNIAAGSRLLAEGEKQS